jgi:error-prone DNA polymerase
MPEAPLQNKRIPSFDPPKRSECSARYAELHCRTNFSFLEGASHPDELVTRAAELNLAALAITDRNTLAGVVRAHVAAKEVGLPILIGSEITPNDTLPVVLLATDRASYGRLSQLITLGRRRAEKGSCTLFLDDIASHAEGLLACVILQSSSVLTRVTPRESPASPRLDEEKERLDLYREIFSDRCYGLAELRRGGDDALSLFRMKECCAKARVPLVAAGDVFYHIRERRELQDVLTCVREGCTLREAGEHLFPNAERHLRSAEEMEELFAAVPGAVKRSLEVKDRCSFSLDELRYEYPEELCPPGMRPIDYLKRLTWEGARSRYPAGLPDKVRDLIERELRLIEELRYEAYFLTVWDLVRFARSQNILCQGRGSAANSAVCYCLEVTSVDPDRIEVLFERFISKERNEAPDIDVDFEHQRREEVIQYVYEKYGRERAGMTAEVITYQRRSAIRDVGKALGLSLNRVDALAKGFEGFRDQEDVEFDERLKEAALDQCSPVVEQLTRLASEIITFPRHLSQHVGGLVITQGPLAEIVPIENASMEGRTVIQWDKDDLDSLGILKVDCLALGMLSALHRCFDLVEKHYHRPLTLATVPAEDKRVYDMICKADTIGVFQIESRAQMSMLPRLKPRKFYDLVIEVAIVRPGPIQGDMVHPYLRRRGGEEPVEYPSPAFEKVLHQTLGVPIFQEQAMRLVVEAAGFTPDEADQLRRAMAAWRRKGVLEKFRDKLIRGLIDHGIAVEMAERVYRQIQGFGEYGFPESHAASFAILVYASSWLKCHYPAAFTASILNSLPMGFYAPAQLVRDAREHGVEVRPVDINASDWESTLEPNGESSCALRLGFRLVHGVGEEEATKIMQGRKDGPYRSMDDVARRAQIKKGTLSKLSAADAFQSLELNRRQALWNALVPREEGPLFHDPDEDDAAPLPLLKESEEVVADYRTVGLTLRKHPVSFMRPSLERLRVFASAELPSLNNDTFVKVAGLVLIRQQPGTAKGIRFITLEDETGIVNLIVRQEIWNRYRRMAVRASSLLATGRLQIHGIIIHVLVSKLEDLSQVMKGLKTKSRDFR